MKYESNTYADQYVLHPDDSTCDAVPVHRQSPDFYTTAYENRQDVELAYLHSRSTIPDFLVLNPSIRPYYTLHNTLLVYIATTHTPHHTVLDVEPTTPIVYTDQRFSCYNIHLFTADRMVVYVCCVLICIILACLYVLVVSVTGH